MTASKDMTLPKERVGSHGADELPVPKKAFSTDNPIEIFQFAIDAVDKGFKLALCTLVEIRGGSSRPLGAHMAVADNGSYCGYVSGGCTEAAVAAEALQAISAGHDRFVMLGEGSPFFDIVLPCGGGITVAIHILRNVTPLSSVVGSVNARQNASLSYCPAKEALSFGAVGTATGWDDEVFKTLYRPAVRIVLSGRELEVEMTSKVAKAAGYDVILHSLEDRSFDASVIDENTAVVLLQHDLDQEMALLTAALGAQPFYIGALGSARTHERRVQRLQQEGHSNEVVGQIKAPIGLFGRARDAQSLALSVIAEIAACRQAALPRH